MDIISLVLAKPKIIDLSKFMCRLNEGTLVSFSEQLYYLALTSLTNGGAMQEVRVTDVDGALKKAATTKKQVILRISANDTIDYPTINAYNNRGAGQLSVSGVQLLNSADSTYFTMQVSIQFTYGSDDVRLMVKATLITA